MSDLRIRLLRAWYSLRERLGVPRRLSRDEFDRARSTTLLAGSPWVWVWPEQNSSTGTSITFAVTNVNWLRPPDQPQE